MSALPPLADSCSAAIMPQVPSSGNFCNQVTDDLRGVTRATECLILRDNWTYNGSAAMWLIGPELTSAPTRDRLQSFGGQDERTVLPIGEARER